MVAIVVSIVLLVRCRAVELLHQLPDSNPVRLGLLFESRFGINRPRILERGPDVVVRKVHVIAVQVLSTAFVNQRCS